MRYSISLTDNITTMQNGKISKTLDILVARTAFNTAKNNIHHSYKDMLFMEILMDETSVGYQALSSKMQDWQLFQMRLRLEHEIEQCTRLSDIAPDEFFKIFISSLTKEYPSTEQITTLHAVSNILGDQTTASARLFERYGVAIDSLRIENQNSTIKELPNIPTLNRVSFRPSVSEQRHAPPLQKSHPLDKFGTELTQKARAGEIDPVIGRDREISRMIEILSRRKKNNPILIGEAGVGKSAIVEGLALRIANGEVPYNMVGKQLFSLDISALIAGTKFRGEFEERMQQLIEALRKAEDTIIFIDEIHTIVGAGATQGSLDAANILKPALARGELQTIGATTLDEYRTDIESDAALERRFQKIMVEPTTEEQTLEILRSIAPQYEKHHKVRFTPEALEACVKLSGRYISDRHFPDKAVDLMDEVGARAHINTAIVPQEIEEIEAAISSAKQQRSSAIEQMSYDQAAQIRLNEIALSSRLNERRQEWKHSMELDPIIIGVESVESVITSITAIPAERISLGEMERLRSLQSHLDNHVIGQSEAVARLSKSIYRSKAGLNDHNRPIGVFMFVGPTGVGKTLLAKELSNWMFDQGRGVIRLDMSEYSQKHTLSRLIGSPPGYVGYGEGGQLTEAVRRHPYSVVLFDEIEKAHPEIFNSMLQIFDEGHLTDGSARKVDFRNTIIIMTSNVGSARATIRKTRVGYSTHSKSKSQTSAPQVEYRKAMERTFSPEFLNRIDDIVIFESLKREDVERIIDLELSALTTRAAQLGYTITITPIAKRELATLGYDSKYGARALKRTLADHVEQPLSALIINGELRSGDTVVVDFCSSERVVQLKVA